MSVPACLDDLNDPPFDDPSFDGCLWRVEHEGKPWCIATDGRMALAVQCDCPELAPPEGDWPKRISDLFALLSSTPLATLGPIKAAALREWAGEIGSRLSPCGTCDGEGKYECDHCERTHACGCCDGTGEQVEYDHYRPGEILGVIVDQRRLYRLLDGAEGDCTLTLRQVKLLKMLTITGDGWIAWLMEMDASKVETSDYPRFTQED